MLGEHPAVAAAVTAVEVTSEGTFPEKLVELMLLNALFEDSAVEF